MKITYSKNTLRFDTNEVGFDMANLEALCSIGNSSKASSRQDRRYIGEKGIGFKSVFRVSTEVYVLSGHYSFKFKRDSPLGMITPIWVDKFPGTPLPGFTSILLVLSQQWNAGSIIEQLRCLDARYLMFLRKLREIEVQASEHLEEIVLRRQDIFDQDKIQLTPETG